MDASYLMGAVLGGLEGAVDVKQKGFERGRLEAEEKRKAELLLQRDAMKARAEERLAAMKGVEDRETAQFKHDRSMEKNAAKSADALKLEEVKGGNSATVAKIKGEYGLEKEKAKGGKKNDPIKEQDALRKDYARAAAKAESSMTEIPDFDTWAQTYRPEMYARAFKKEKTTSTADSYVKANLDRVSQYVKTGANTELMQSH